MIQTRISKDVTAKAVRIAKLKRSITISKNMQKKERELFYKATDDYKHRVQAIQRGIEEQEAQLKELL